jgi:hypothetical protein
LGSHQADAAEALTMAPPHGQLYADPPAAMMAVVALMAAMDPSLPRLS